MIKSIGRSNRVVDENFVDEKVVDGNFVDGRVVDNIASTS